MNDRPAYAKRFEGTNPEIRAGDDPFLFGTAGQSRVQGDCQSVAASSNVGRCELPGGVPVKIQGRFHHKLSIVEEEADECGYWLELLEKLPAPNSRETARLKNEAGQLVAIMVPSKKTARSNATV